jgi:hypothetical protein
MQPGNAGTLTVAVDVGREDGKEEAGISPADHDDVDDLFDDDAVCGRQSKALMKTWQFANESDSEPELIRQRRALHASNPTFTLADCPSNTIYIIRV